MREFIDSREGFSAEEEAMHIVPQGWEMIEGNGPTTADMELAAENVPDYEEMDAMFTMMDEADGEEYDDEYEDDGQPTEYEEYQDFYGGDDWDHGQYDDCDY